MGHHSMDEMPDEFRDRQQEDLIRKLKADHLQSTIGASGHYPMGKLHESDEGEIVFGVTSHRGKVILNFGKPVAWMGMDAHQARSLAALLLKHAERSRDIGADERKDEMTARVSETMIKTPA